MAKKKIKRRGKVPPNMFEDGGVKKSWGQQSSEQFSKAFKGENLGSSIGSIGDAVGSIAQAGISNAQIADTSGIEAQNKAQKNMVVGASSNDDLMSEWGSWNKSKDNYSWKDIRGGSTGQRIMNTIGATTSGATTGATVGGPIGAAVGGAVGLHSAIWGWVGGNSKAKRKARQLNEQAKEANERALSSFETRAENIDTQNDFNMLANFSAYGGPLEFGSGAIGYEFGNEDLNNQKMSAIAKQRLTSLPNSFQALPEMNTHNAFAEGGWLGTGINENVATAASFLPVVGTVMDGAEFIKDPSWENAGWFLGGLASDIFTGGAGRAALKGVKLARRTAKAAEALKAKRLNAALKRGNQSYSTSMKAYRKAKALESKANQDIINGVGKIAGIQGADILLNSTQQNTKAFGGWLNTQGGDFTNGVTFIDEGGSHEENPYQGIQIGVDPEGAPNLVEEGEVVYDDYVFSDRMEIPDDIRKEYKLRGKTFAKAAKSAQRESEERPNDPISTKGLQAAMERIATAQEEARQRKGVHRKGNEYPSMFRNGGDTNSYGLALEDPMTVEELEALMAQSEGTSKKAPEGNNNKRQTWTRYAPIMGSGLASLTDLFSKPDYGSADIVGGVDLGAEAAGYAPIGNYLSYRPLDRDFYINKMNQQAAATRRGLMNTSGGNRLNAQAGILAADYNYGQNMGNLARQAEEYNQQLRERVEAFNRGTNMFNTETGLKTSMFNAESRNAAKRARLGQATTAAQLRQGIKDQDAARRSANITNFLQGLGDMGWENEQANWLDTLAKSGVLKVNTKGEYTGGTKKAEGGKVKTKKKKGLTYG